MNGRERFAAVMAHRPVDRAPDYELGAWGQTVERWHGEGLPRDACFWNWFEGEPYFGLERRGFAMVDVAMVPRFDAEVLEESDRWVLHRNEDGTVSRALKEGFTRGTRASMDQYVSHPVTDRESWRAMARRYDPCSPVRYPQWWDALKAGWEGRDYPLSLLGNGTAGLYSQLRTWVGTEEISYLFFDDTALVEEMLETYTDFLLAVTERARREVRFDFFNFFEDFAGKGGPLISPDLFRKFLLPRYRRIIEAFRASGITCFWLDSDGDPRPLIPLLLEAGITCLWPNEIAAGCDPLELRRTYGSALALAGGVDKREIARGRREIDEELDRLRPLVESGGFIPHLDHTVPPDISLDNFRYYLEQKRRLLGR